MMMNYEEFKEKVQNEIEDYLPEMFRGRFEMKNHEVFKTNRKLDSINFTEHNSNIGPNIYVNYLYEKYMDIGNFDVTMNIAVNILIESVENLNNQHLEENIVSNIDREMILNNVTYRLINKAQNAEMLAGSPSRSFLDLAIVYYVVVHIGEDGVGAIRITNTQAKEFNLSEKEIFEAAASNTPKMFPAKVSGMLDALRGLGMPSDVLFDNDDIYIPDENILVVSNTLGINGAAVTLYPEVLEGISNKIGDKFFILPSSIHEVLVVKDDGNRSIKELQDMVCEVNTGCVTLGERLSNNVYQYNNIEQRLYLMTHSDRMLDGTKVPTFNTTKKRHR